MTIHELIQQAAAKHGLDPAFFARLVGAESSGNPNAVSPKGATGLGQLMPGTAKAMGVTDPRDPAQNLDGSAKYLSQLMGKYGGDKTKALAAYNWGPGNLARANEDVSRAPAETQSYLQRILQPGGGLPPEPPPIAPMPPEASQAVALAAPAPAPAPTPVAPAVAPTADPQQQLAMQALMAGGGQAGGGLASLLLNVPGAGARIGRAPAAAPSPLGMGLG